jgi:hypothetical protein
MVTFISYFDQMIAIANQNDIDLRLACINAGIKDSTYYRWMNNKTTPNEDSARKVMATMQGMIHDAA